MPGTTTATTTQQGNQQAQGNEGQQTTQGQGEGQGTTQQNNAPKTVSVEEYNRVLAERNQYAQQASNNNSASQKKDPFEGYTDDQLINMKYDAKTAQYAPLIDVELHKRNREFAASKSQHSVNSKINEMAALGLHPDMRNPGSALHQRYQQILHQEMPFLKEQVNGAIIAAKMAVGEFSLSTQVMNNGKSNNENNNTTTGADGVPVETQQQRTNLRGSGQNTNPSNKKTPDQMNDQEFEDFVSGIKMAGYQQG